MSILLAATSGDVTKAGKAIGLALGVGLGVDLALRLLHSPLPVDLGLFLDALLHRLAHLAGLAEDLLRLGLRLADQLAVLIQQFPGLVACGVGLVQRAADPLLALVDQLLDRCERVALQNEERNEEADDRPDHQPGRDLDKGIGAEQHLYP